jgi:hypothetical protein
MRQLDIDDFRAELSIVFDGIFHRAAYFLVQTVAEKRAGNADFPTL